MKLMCYIKIEQRRNAFPLAIPSKSFNQTTVTMRRTFKHLASPRVHVRIHPSLHREDFGQPYLMTGGIN